MKANATHSMLWTERLRRTIPWGSSTCSKAPRFLPEEPGVIVRGEGCRVWDADGREYIDFRNSLGPITLGYRFPAVDAAIREQLDRGIVFGHPHPLECEVAEAVCEIIPCAEQARFLKTGGEAIAACIRIARAYTGRDHILQIGYNGWLNTLGTGSRTPTGQAAENVPLGVPRALSALHHICAWNDLPAIERVFAELPGQVAAVVVASDYANIAAGEVFYPALRALTTANGSLLIFDEIVTGFRIALGGAQEYFQTVPDLAVFSKGIANGMPLSVYVGRREVMSVLDRGAVVSSTFAGEALSLAAAKAAIQTYRTQDVIGHLWRQGEKMWGGLNRLLEENGIPACLKGFWPCPQIVFDGHEAGRWREAFFRAAYRNGVSLYDVSYVNFSHRDADLEEALERLERACREVRQEATT
ncbi:MAG TPA: aminotransferase class III-fold pyridoxal phosphate-dependent enzyme [Chthonomonadales bacterium]|nr:aminotransferase class III-fold pyridoxal phosphate-dependent enzyme [Chthonomonadales bacterium]